MERNLQIQSSYGKGLEIKNLEGNEGISQLYQLNLTLTSKNPNLGSDGIGQPLTISIDTEQTTRHLSGIITDFGYLHEDPDELDYHLYTCTVRPSLWYLSQRIDSRVFVDKNIIDIATTLLNDMGINYQNNCQNSYRNYGHSIQYQETSLDYLSRLFEQEGIYYYFEHSAGNHTLILSDNNAQQHPIMGKTTLPYHSKYIHAGTPDQAYLDSWQHTDHLNTKQVSVNDYNYQMAKTKLTASGSTHDLGGQTTEQYDFYTNFKDPAQASHYKTIRTEDHKAQSQIINASGNVLTIAPGYTFSLERHPHQASNSEYLITQAHYHFQEAGNTTGQDLSYYRIDFTAIPKAHQYRAPRITAKPRMLGTQAATITGPAGEEVYTNAYGDIKLQFHWDRYGPMNEKSSDWIRVIQGSAGGGFGSINTPRIGEEVLVDFINGDSDRPIVVGRLYNSANPPPWGFPASAKKSGIKSKSFNSPLSNFNELMFDDTAGTELVNFQAQKDLTSLIKHDETRTVNHDRTTTIDNDETVTVHGFRTETVDKDETITIHQNRTETVDKNETIIIHENRKERVDKDETISIGGNRTETVEKNEKIEVHGNRTESVKKNETVTINQNQKHTVQKNRSLTVNHNNTEMVKIAKSVTVGTVYTTQVGVAMNTLVGMMQAEEVGMVKKTMVGKNYGITAGEQFQLKVGDSSLILNADGSIVIKGNSILIEAKDTHILKGNDVHINPEPVGAKENLSESFAPEGDASAEEIDKIVADGEKNGWWAGPVTGDVKDAKNLPQKITLQQMQKMWPNVKAEKLEPIMNELNANLSTYKLDTPTRQAFFFGQIKQETGPRFSLKENLGQYSEKALLANFSYYKKHPEEAKIDSKITDKELKTKTIANKVYMDENRPKSAALGNVYSGDGYKFIGRGLKQTTGRYNYTTLNNTYSKIWPDEDINFLENPEKLEEPKYASRSAVVFWLDNKLYDIADKGVSDDNIDKVTKVINKYTPPESYANRRKFTKEASQIFK